MIKPLAGLLAGLCFASAAHAKPPICEHPYPACSPSHHAIQEDRCAATKCSPLAQPPAMPNVYCTYLGGGYECTVWPRGPDMSYTYSASGPVQVSDTGPTNQPSVWVQCGLPARPGGVLSVTAYSPVGLASPTKTIPLACRQRIEQ